MFNDDGFICSIDYDFANWVKYLTISLDYYDQMLQEAIENGQNLLQQSMELIFLSEKVYPFLLKETHDLILQGSEEFWDKNTLNTGLLRSWKTLSEIFSGFRLYLSIFEGRV
jgi:hypothetical protein